MERNEDSTLSSLPRAWSRFLAETSEAEFATVSASGLAISNPLFHYVEPRSQSLSLATGVAYPGKANRARAHPSVSLVIAPGIHAYDPPWVRMHGVPADPDACRRQPVMLMQARAVVLDEDIQENTDRYVRLFMGRHAAVGPEWDVMKRATWYWPRIWIECVPERIWWWANGLEAMQAGQAAQEWSSSIQHTQTPPVPRPGRANNGTMGSARQASPNSGWRDEAVHAARNYPHPIVTSVGREGYPAPAPALSVTNAEAGFGLELAAERPWQPDGAARLTFGSIAAFQGNLVTEHAGRARFEVDYVLKKLPPIFDPTDDQRSALVRRLRRELDALGQPMPQLRGPRES